MKKLEMRFGLELAVNHFMRRSFTGTCYF